MVKRVTIVIDEEVDKKLRIIQTDLIKKEQKSVSFSFVINEKLKEVL